MTPLPEYLLDLNLEDLNTLFAEAETLYNTGLLPLDAKMRKIAELYADDPQVFHLNLVSFHVYRLFALLLKKTGSS